MASRLVIDQSATSPVPPYDSGCQASTKIPDAGRARSSQVSISFRAPDSPSSGLIRIALNAGSSNSSRTSGRSSPESWTMSTVPLSEIACNSCCEKWHASVWVHTDPLLNLCPDRRHRRQIHLSPRRREDETQMARSGLSSRDRVPACPESADLDERHIFPIGHGGLL